MVEDMIQKPADADKGGGIEFVHIKGELTPPVPEEAELPSEKEIAPKLGKIPLQPAFIRLIFRLPGEALAEFTQYPGWRLSEEALADIAEVWESMNIETAPWVQALIIPVAAYAEKYVAWNIWKRAGKPGLKEKVVGSVPPPDRGG